MWRKQLVRSVLLLCVFGVPEKFLSPLKKKKKEEKSHQIYKHAALLKNVHHWQISDAVIVHKDKRRCLKIAQSHIYCEICRFVIKLLMVVFFSSEMHTFLTAILSLLLHHSWSCMCAVCVCVLFLSSPCPSCPSLLPFLLLHFLDCKSRIRWPLCQLKADSLAISHFYQGSCTKVYCMMIQVGGGCGGGGGVNREQKAAGRQQQTSSTEEESRVQTGHLHFL